MEENYKIYKFTFSDGKVYIGQTKEELEDRWKGGEGYKGQAVYVPITLDGWDNVKKEVLHTDLTAEQADKLEKHYIKQFNAQVNGYNRNSGRTRKPKIPDKIELTQEVIDDLYTKCPEIRGTGPNKVLTLQEISNLFKKDPNTIVIWQHIGGFFSEGTVTQVLNMSDVCSGGCGYELPDYLAQWRCWSDNPDIKKILRTPWSVTRDDVLGYNACFFTNKVAIEAYLVAKTIAFTNYRGKITYDKHPININ